MSAALLNWPTPQARDYLNDTNSQGQDNRHSPNLPNISRQWATPCAREANGKPGPNAQMETLAGQVSHQHETTLTDGPNGSQRVDLNPFFVATLMGLPADWLTHSTSAVTASCRKQLRKPSDNYSPDEIGA